MTATSLRGSPVRGDLHCAVLAPAGVEEVDCDGDTRAHMEEALSGLGHLHQVLSPHRGKRLLSVEPALPRSLGKAALVS